MKRILVMALAGLSAAGALADDVIFDARVNGGVYSSRSAEKLTSPVIDVTGALVIGDSDGLNFGVDMGMVTAVRDGNAKIIDADMALKARYLSAQNKMGFEASMPYKYRRDDNYYELSAIEVSAIIKVAEGNGHQLLAKVGINPFTKRTYGNEYGSVFTSFDPVAAGSNSIDRPSYAKVDGSSSYNHDSDADYTSADNRDVFFGGGTVQRDVETTFDTLEYSFRVPVALEYKYKSKDKKLVINAVAYYTLRTGTDKLVQNDHYIDRYQGYVSYANVAWRTCSNSDGSSYSCDPYNSGYAGQGKMTDRFNVRTDLESKSFVAHNLGGKVDASYSVYKNRLMELLLNVGGKAEYDSHVMDAVGESHSSARVMATGGALVRF